MSEVIVATLNVSFDTDTETTGGLKLEVDDREDGLNGGETSFQPGQSVYYFLFKDDNVEVLDHQCTAGGIVPLVDATIEERTKAIDENISFSNSDTASLGYPPSGAITMKWLGRVFVIDKSGVVLPYEGVSENGNPPTTPLPTVSGSELKIAGGKMIAGVLNCQYDTVGDLFKLTEVPVDILETMVFAVGKID